MRKLQEKKALEDMLAGNNEEEEQQGEPPILESKP